MTEITDAAGNVIADTYNTANWRTARSVTRATGFLDTTSESWAYDGMGRMTEAQDNDYKVEFTYAVQGLRSMVYEEKQSNVGGSAQTKTVQKTYDVMGRKATELYDSGTDLDYTWNDIGRLSSVSDGTNTIASYTYVGSRVKEVEFQNGATATYSYTGFRSEVERIHHETSTPATILDLQYAYDDNHDRLYERYGGTSASGDAFEYDDARRLDVAWMGSATPASPSSAAYTKKIEYTMDDDGNRSSVKVTPHGQSASTTSYTDNNLNQYTNVGGTGYSYDLNGNLTDDGTYEYEYNFRNLLCRVKDKGTGSTVATYRHDALGRRVKKLIGMACERFVYSGAEIVAVYDISDSLAQEFVCGQVIDEVLMLEQADVLDFDGDSNTSELTRSFYHRNALGSVMEITEMDEDVAVSYRYDPYGAVTITRNSTEQSSDPLGQSVMYTGRWLDEETELMHYRARAYSSAIGRFLQRDPLSVDAGPNVYEYVRSAPTVYVDPEGLLTGCVGAILSDCVCRITWRRDFVHRPRFDSPALDTTENRTFEWIFENMCRVDGSAASPRCERTCRGLFVTFRDNGLGFPEGDPNAREVDRRFYLWNRMRGEFRFYRPKGGQATAERETQGWRANQWSWYCE